MAEDTILSQKFNNVVEGKIMLPNGFDKRSKKSLKQGRRRGNDDDESGGSDFEESDLSDDDQISKRPKGSFSSQQP